MSLELRRTISRAGAVAVLLLSVVAAVEQSSIAGDAVRDDQARLRAEELIKLARAGIGGEEAIESIQTLSTSAKSRRFVKYVSVQSPNKVVEKQRTLDGDHDLEFAFPDKFRQRLKMETLRGFGYSYAEIVNGDGAWRDPPLRPISSNRDSRVVDVGDVQRTELMSAQGARQQLTFYVFGWLLEALPSFPLDLKYAGQEQTSLGKADVIVAEGKGGFGFLLLLDTRTHMPLALAVPFVETRSQTVLVETAGFFDRRFMMETFARARQERQARARPARRRELQLRFSDYRQVAGVLLPHRMMTTIDGEVEEEMVFDGFRVNQQINPKKFAAPRQKD